MTEMKNPAGQGGALAVDVVTDTREHTITTANNGSAVSREGGYRCRAAIVVLNGRWRVVVFGDGLQWALQRRDGQRHGRARWTGTRYFRTHHALVEACRALCGRCDPAAFARLARLARLALMPEVIR